MLVTMPPKRVFGIQPKESARYEDWLPEDTPDMPVPYLTRSELVNHPRLKPLRIKEGDFRYWESKRVLPKSIRRGYGAESKALQPLWVVPILAALFELKDAGYTLSQAVPVLKRHSRHLLLYAIESGLSIEMHLPSGCPDVDQEADNRTYLPLVTKRKPSKAKRLAQHR